MDWEAIMICSNCGHKDKYNSQFCMKCGHPLRPNMPQGANQGHILPFLVHGRKRVLAISISAAAVLLIVLVLILILSANPVAGRWYAQDGTELFFLQNGKGMTVTDTLGDSGQVHFMYAVGYREAGYTEGEIYEKDKGDGTWFYLYDGKLEWNGQYFYRQKPSQPSGVQ
jgi:hypothetical protein